MVDMHGRGSSAPPAVFPVVAASSLCICHSPSLLTSCCIQWRLLLTAGLRVLALEREEVFYRRGYEQREEQGRF